MPTGHQDHTLRRFHVKREYASPTLRRWALERRYGKSSSLIVTDIPELLPPAKKARVAAATEIISMSPMP
jgi:hypothetical protein